MASGLTSKTETFENSSTYDRKGRLRIGESAHSLKMTVHHNGAVNEAAGNTEVDSFGYKHVSKYEYNKNGTFKSSYSHGERTGSHPSVSDEYTVLKRDKVKKNMRVAASLADTEIKAIKKNKEFSGEISTNGSEHFY